MASSPSPKSTSSKSHSKHVKKPSPIIDQVGPFDVLCGKDKTYAKHQGNTIYRRLIDENAGRYHEASNKQEKMNITKQIVQRLQLQYNSRFLRPNGEHWELVPENLARDKTSHALRFTAQKSQEDAVKLLKFSTSNGVDVENSTNGEADPVPSAASAKKDGKHKMDPPAVLTSNVNNSAFINNVTKFPRFTAAQGIGSLPTSMEVCDIIKTGSSGSSTDENDKQVEILFHRQQEILNAQQYNSTGASNMTFNQGYSVKSPQNDDVSVADAASSNSNAVSSTKTHNSGSISAEPENSNNVGSAGEENDDDEDDEEVAAAQITQEKYDTLRSQDLREILSEPMQGDEWDTVEDMAE